MGRGTKPRGFNGSNRPVEAVFLHPPPPLAHSWLLHLSILSAWRASPQCSFLRFLFKSSSLVVALLIPAPLRLVWRELPRYIYTIARPTTSLGRPSDEPAAYATGGRPAITACPYYTQLSFVRTIRRQVTGSDL